MTKVTPDVVAALAREVAMTDNIDYGMSAVDESSAFELIASSVVEHYQTMTDAAEQHLMMLSVITKLIVENMVLHDQLKNRTHK